MRKFKCAVLGATGVVGQHFLQLLADHPYFELAAVCASDARAGQRLGDIKALIPDGIPGVFADLLFEPLDVHRLKANEVELAFSALPADIANSIEKECTQEGIHIFSNASSYRMDPRVPILIPEVNYPHLQLARAQLQHSKGFIITNANCTTTGLVMALLPIMDMDIRRLIVASYQAISGAGYPGISAMDILGNVIPYINGEEPKMRMECVKICGLAQTDHIAPADWEVHAHCLRVPTIVGHMISVHIELGSTVSQDEVESRFVNYVPPAAVAGLPTAPIQPVLFTRDKARPQPIRDVMAGEAARAAGMAVTVGRLEAANNIIRLVTLSNNLVRGAAGGSVLNAELAQREGLL